MVLVHECVPPRRKERDENNSGRLPPAPSAARSSEKGYRAREECEPAEVAEADGREQNAGGVRPVVHRGISMGTPGTEFALGWDGSALPIPVAAARPPEMRGHSGGVYGPGT